jgi:hypothetical protein
MDIKSIAEFIKEIGAILVTLIGVGGAIIANINKVRGAKEIQRLTKELMVETSREPGSETLPILREALSAKKQDVTQNNQKILVYIIISISFLVIGMLLSLLVISIIKPSIPTITPPVSFTQTSTLPDNPALTSTATFASEATLNSTATLTSTATLDSTATFTSTVPLTSTPAFTSTSDLTSTPTFTSTPSFTSTPTFGPVPYACPYQGGTDNETIVGLIQAEAIASNTKDISIIQAIFDPDAIFYDFAFEPTKSWNGPLARYADDLFTTTDFKNVEHFDILPVEPGISGDTAFYTSGSKGYYRINGADWNKFFNGSLESKPSTQYGSEHWILKKNSSGCWAIVQMEFNAGNEKFPK